MPGSPTLEERTVSSNAGDLRVSTASVKGDQGTLFSVVWVDYPVSALAARTVDQVLDGARDGSVAGLRGGTLTSSQNVLLSAQYPGRDFRAAFSGGTGDYRIYLVGNRMYSLSVISTDAGATGDATRFFDSFKLLN